ncbi:helix-turn-helix domain-containing protein [Halobacillus fulvus]|nr:helix-turn-helix domain-containing protein [Halobacillus fulvus]
MPHIRMGRLKMLGDRMKVIRLKRGYSISELAQLSNVSKSYVSEIEKGAQTNPSLNVLQRLAVTLDVPVDHLVAEPRTKMAEQLDHEWVTLIRQAMDENVDKKDFKTYINYIKYENYRENEKNERKKGSSA